MRNLMKNKTESIVSGVIGIMIVISLFVIWLVNDAIPFMMDDIWYAEKLVSFEPSGIPIRTLRDLIESQIWHYNNWGGRSITHGLLQIQLQLNSKVIDVMNTFATLLLGWIMCLVADIWEKPWKSAGIFCGIGLLLGLNANWQLSMFWQSGAANYLYITGFLLLFLYCYFRDDEKDHLWGISIWIIPLGLASGWSNENMGPTMWILSALVILIRFVKKQKVHLWMILGNLSCMIGSVLVIIAPGNFVRSDEAANDYSYLWNLFLRCYAESKAALEFLFPTILLLTVVLIIGKGILDIKIGQKNLLLLLGGLLSWGAMILSPHYPDRATFGTMILLFCVILNMSKKISEINRKYAGMMLLLMTLIWLRGMFLLGEYMAVIWGWIK